jgi:hypothetical protein
MAATGGSYERSAPAAGAPRGRTAMVWFPRRADYTSETKPFYLTSEFLVFVLYTMGLGISATTDATIDSRFFWLMATIVTAAYILSRGIAKAATRSRAHDPREDVG